MKPFYSKFEKYQYKKAPCWALFSTIGGKAEIASHDTLYRLLLLIHSAFSLTGTLLRTFHSASNSFSQSSNQKSALLGALFNNWRKGRDSNSGRDRSLDGFQDRCIKPLCHLSILTLFTCSTSR